VEEPASEGVASTEVRDVELHPARSQMRSQPGEMCHSGVVARVEPFAMRAAICGEHGAERLVDGEVRASGARR